MADHQNGRDETGSADSRAALDALLRHYSPKVLEVWRTRRNFGTLPQPEGRGEAATDCGDRIEIHLRARDGRVLDAAFTSEGCAATFAVGSAAAELARGRTAAGLLTLDPEDLIAELDGLPETNHHCADLAVAALRRAARDLMATGIEPWKRLYRP